MAGIQSHATAKRLAQRAPRLHCHPAPTKNRVADFVHLSKGSGLVQGFELLRELRHLPLYSRRCSTCQACATFLDLCSVLTRLTQSCRTVESLADQLAVNRLMLILYDSLLLACSWGSGFRQQRHDLSFATYHERPPRFDPASLHDRVAVLLQLMQETVNSTAALIHLAPASACSRRKQPSHCPASTSIFAF